MKRIVLLACLLAACDGDDPAPDSILVSAYRYDAVADCDAELATGDPTSMDLLAANVPAKPCATPLATDYKLQIGDRIDLVIDYGDLPFTEATAVTAPTITTTIDGASSTLNATFVLQPKITGHTYFKGSFVVPAKPHAVMELLVLASQDFTRPKALTFEIADSDVRVLIDQCTDQSSCSVRAGGQVTARISATGQSMQTAVLRAGLGTADAFTAMVALTRPVDGNRIEGTQTLDVPSVSDDASWFVTAELGPGTDVHAPITIGDPGLSITAVCTSPCLGGEASATVEITTQANKAQTVLLRQLVDGIPQTTVQQVTLDEHDGTGFSKSVVIAPTAVQVATNIAFRAELGQFLSTPAAISVVPPTIEVKVDQCATDSCSALGGASTITVRATVSGKHAQQVTLRALLNNVPQTGSLGTINANQLVMGGGVTGTLNIDPPLAPANSTWTIVGELSGSAAVFDEYPVTLTTPLIAVSNDACSATPCELSSGVGRATVSVSVEGTKTQKVTVRSVINGLTVFSQDVALNDVVNGRARGSIPFDVPVVSSGSTWTLTTSLGDAIGTSQPATLRPPVLTAVLACGAACHPPVGTTTSLSITAPIGLRDKSVTVLVTSSTGNVTTVSSPTALSIEDVGAQTVNGSVPIAIPQPANGLVQIDVLVGGFRAPTLFVTAGP